MGVWQGGEGLRILKQLVPLCAAHSNSILILKSTQIFLPLLFLVPYCLAFLSSSVIFCSKNSDFLFNIPSVSLSFWMASWGVGSPFFPLPNIFWSKDMPARLKQSQVKRNLNCHDGFPMSRLVFSYYYQTYTITRIVAEGYPCNQSLHAGDLTRKNLHVIQQFAEHCERVLVWLNTCPHCLAPMQRPKTFGLISSQSRLCLTMRRQLLARLVTKRQVALSIQVLFLLIIASQDNIRSLSVNN